MDRNNRWKSIIRHCVQHLLCLKLMDDEGLAFQTTQLAMKPSFWSEIENDTIDQYKTVEPYDQEIFPIILAVSQSFVKESEKECQQTNDCDNNAQYGFHTICFFLFSIEGTQ